LSQGRALEKPEDYAIGEWLSVNEFYGLCEQLGIQP
jgi:hypothetical protein